MQGPLIKLNIIILRFLFVTVVTAHWNDRTPEQGISHILMRLGNGTERLHQIREGGGFPPLLAPGVTMDESFKTAGLPLDGDK